VVHVAGLLYAGIIVVTIALISVVLERPARK
jgi:hypothetical protein